jgi:ephrin-B
MSSNSLKMSNQLIIFASLIICVVGVPTSEGRKVHYIHWNRANPMFRLDNTDHIVDVNVGNQPWEYDQVNIICPVSKPGVRYPETHVIYSVTRDQFDSCRITNPKPKIVAICNQPHKLMYFTITFRSFTPTPGGLEFKPGQDYYFISTSTNEDLHSRVGGGCATHNMKMVFRVADNRSPDGRHVHINGPRDDDLSAVAPPTTTTTSTTTTTTEKPLFRFNSKVPNMRGKYIYYYHPRDLIELESNSISNKEVERDYQNEIWSNEALMYTSSSSGLSTSFMMMSAIVSLLILWR